MRTESLLISPDQKAQISYKSHTSTPLDETESFHEDRGEKRSTRLAKRGNDNGRRYLGVRKRPSGRWVAEIKDSSQKLRLWLGTFDRLEEAALAYDSAARLLQGRNARTNFQYHGHGVTNAYQESRSLIGKNPRLYQLLRHAIMKNHARSSSLGSLGVLPWKNQDSTVVGSAVDPIDFDILVEETIYCSSTSSYYSDHDHQDSNNNNHLSQLSLGSSKVYSSVFVAPSFSSGKNPLHQGGEEN